MLTALVIVAEEANELQQLALPIWAFPLIAAAFFILAGAITFSFRDVAHRHAQKADAAAAGDDHGHGAHGGH
jgi:hypothetical protein